MVKVHGFFAPARFIEGQLIPWSVGLVLRMIVCGVESSGIRRPRRAVWRRLAATAHAWFAWTTALPGDHFYCLTRDLLVEVRGGLPGEGRTAAVVVSKALDYPVVQRVGLDALFALLPTERCGWSWWEVEVA